MSGEAGEPSADQYWVIWGYHELDDVRQNLQEKADAESVERMMKSIESVETIGNVKHFLPPFQCKISLCADFADAYAIFNLKKNDKKRVTMNYCVIMVYNKVNFIWTEVESFGNPGINCYHPRFITFQGVLDIISSPPYQNQLERTGEIPPIYTNAISMGGGGQFFFYLRDSATWTAVLLSRLIIPRLQDDPDLGVYHPNQWVVNLPASKSCFLVRGGDDFDHENPINEFASAVSRFQTDNNRQPNDNGIDKYLSQALRQILSIDPVQIPLYLDLEPFRVAGHMEWGFGKAKSKVGYPGEYMDYFANSSPATRVSRFE